MQNSGLWNRTKIKESEKRYLDFVRGPKKLWNVKKTVITIVIGALEIIPKGLVNGLDDLETRGQVEIIQTMSLLRSARILRRVLEIKETCCRSNSIERPLASHTIKTLKEYHNDNYNPNGSTT